MPLGLIPTRPEMKKFSILLIVLFSSSLLVNAQPTVNDVAGAYSFSLASSSPSHSIEYILNLNADGTFVFHSYDKIESGIPTERNKYGKGTWTLDKKVVYFSTSSTDFNEKYTLDFNTSKARFISKHPSDKSDRIIKTALQFYESDIFWIHSLSLLKIE